MDAERRREGLGNFKKTLLGFVHQFSAFGLNVITHLGNPGGRRNKLALDVIILDSYIRFY